MSLRLRLALVVLVAAGAALAFLTWRTVAELRPRYQEAMEEAMVDIANVLAAWLSTEAGDGAVRTAGIEAAMAEARGRVLDARIYDVVKRDVALEVTVTDARGTVLYASADPAEVGSDYSRWNDIARTLAGRYGARATWADPEDPASAVLHVAAPVMAGGRLIGVLSVAKPVDALTIFLDTARRELALAYAAVAGLAVLVAAFATSWITAPIRRLTRHVEAVKAGSPEPLPPLGRGEVASLGAAFAGLHVALDVRPAVQLGAQTLTHEMKSPLTSIRGAAELLAEDPPDADRRRFIANIGQEARRLHDLIERLLQLAALERRSQPPPAEEVDAARLVADVVGSLAPAAAARSVTVATSCEPGLAARGEPFLIRQALANLVQNAIDFAPAGTAVEVAARGVDGMAELTVADRGPGIPDYARERIFERFFSLPRPDSGRKGTGLGLTFAREVALAHGGAIAVGLRPGGGTIATVRLPGFFTGPPR